MHNIFFMQIAESLTKLIEKSLGFKFCEAFFLVKFLLQVAASDKFKDLIQTVFSFCLFYELHNIGMFNSA